MQSHCPPSLTGLPGAIGQLTLGPRGDYGVVLGGRSQLRLRKAVPRQKGQPLELGSKGVRAGLDEPSLEVGGEVSSPGGGNWPRGRPLHVRDVGKS